MSNIMSFRRRYCAPFISIGFVFSAFAGAAWALDVKVRDNRTNAAANPANVLAPSLIKRPSKKNCPPVVPAKFPGAPEGFGNRFVWDRCDDQILLLLVVNASNNIGIPIENVLKGDQILLGPASGIATFSKDTGNPRLAGLVGVLAKGAVVAGTVAGCPECAPVIEAANSFAQNEFKAPKEDAERKPRDAYGKIPGKKEFARQEGGVIICLPEADGLVTSGDGDNTDLWIRKPGIRSDKNVPDQAKACFFPIRSNALHNTRKVKLTGSPPSVLFVGAWDHKFADNKGFYILYLKIEKAGTRQTKVTGPNVN
jgi:hypothetical protein